MLSARRSRSFILLAFLLVLPSFSCITKTKSAYVAPPPELVFSPKKHELGRVFEGVHTGTVTLQNATKTTLKDVSVTTTCHCLMIKGPDHFDTLAPGQSVEIPFAFDIVTHGPARQALVANVGKKNRLYYHTLYAFSIFPVGEMEKSELTFPDLTRKQGGERSQTVTLSKPIDLMAKGVTLTTSVSWLHIKTRYAGDRIVFEASAAPFAPDGPFSVPAKINYQKINGRTNMDATISGRIISEITAEPALVSFGFAPRHAKPESKQCTIYVNAPLAAPVTVSCDDARVDAKVTRQETNQITLEIGVDTVKSGEIDSIVHVLQDSKRLTDIPVSAFISP